MEKIINGGALHFARIGEFNSVLAIISRNLNQIDINSKDREGRTIASYAAEYGSVQGLKIAIKLNADIELPDKNLLTPLMYSAKNGNIGCSNLILLKDINIDAIDKNGWTALMHAAANGRTQDVKLLLDKGAKKEIKNDEHLSAAAIAKLHGWKELHLFIKEFKKRSTSDFDDEKKLLESLKRGMTYQKLQDNKKLV